LKARFKSDVDDLNGRKGAFSPKNQTEPTFAYNSGPSGSQTHRSERGASLLQEGKQPHDIKAPPKKKLIEHIPCLYLPYEEGGNKVVIYFHGNAEDIGLAFDLLYLFGQRMEMHVLAVEYPGYGLYKTSKPNEDQIKADSEAIYDYLVNCVGLNENDIILFGRSMGSGPTSYLSSVRNPYALLLMSPYTSIKEAAKSLLGWASFLSVIVYDKFRNIDMIKKARCPVFFLHGQQDTLIPHQHSEDLHAACPRESYLHLPEKMDHNEFLLEEDLITPFKDFISKLQDGMAPYAKPSSGEEEKNEESEDSAEGSKISSKNKTSIKNFDKIS